jgi:hypothetical protein
MPTSLARVFILGAGASGFAGCPPALEQLLCRGRVAPLRQQKVDGLAGGINRTVKVFPLAGDLDQNQEIPIHMDGDSVSCVAYDSRRTNHSLFSC